MQRLAPGVVALFLVACAPSGGSGRDGATPGTDATAPPPESGPGVALACDPEEWDGSMGVCGRFHVLEWLGPPMTFPPTGVPLATMTGAVFEIRDLTDPLGAPLTATTDAEGFVAFILQLPFDVLACATVPGRVDTCTHWFGAAPLGAFSDRGWSAAASEWTALHAAAGVAEDPASGVFVGSTGGESGLSSPAHAGYTVTADPAGLVVYRSEGVPDPAATATDDWGGFIVFGVPAGPATLTVTNGATTTVREVHSYAGTLHVVLVPR